MTTDAYKVNSLGNLDRASPVEGRIVWDAPLDLERHDAVGGAGAGPPHRHGLRVEVAPLRDTPTRSADALAFGRIALQAFAAVLSRLIAIAAVVLAI
jgi:hypothetical protein